MAREPVRVDSLQDAEVVASHGKTYALAPSAQGDALTVYRVGRELATEFGGAANRDAALRLVEDDASGLAQKRAERFFKWLDASVEKVRDGVSGPLLAAGYEPWHMGGGCLAWGKNLPDGSHILLCTEDNAIDEDPEASEWVVGRYGSEGGFVFLQKPLPLGDAIRVAELLPAPLDGNGVASEVACDSLEEVAAAMESQAAAPRQ